MKKKYRVDHVRAAKEGERKVRTRKFTDLAEARACFSSCELSPETRYIRLCVLVRTPLSLKSAKTWKRIGLRRGPALEATKLAPLAP
jgi:hypothetical protein